MPKATNRKEGSKRDKYTLQACFECQRRKIKCSGERRCSSCRTRSIECQYAGDDQHEAPSQRKRAGKEYTDPASPPSCARKRRKTKMSLKEQIFQLQEQVNALSKANSQINTNMQTAARVKAVIANVSDSDESPTTIAPSSTWIVNRDMFCNSSNASPSSFQQIPSPLKAPSEPDTIEATSPPSNSLPIDSQLNTLRKLRHGSALIDPDNSFQDLLAAVKLPAPRVLWDLVSKFFEDFESYFPCLNQDMIYERLSEILSLHGFHNGNHQIVIDSRHCKIVAILLNMLAYAESLTFPIESCNPRPISRNYLQGLKLMQHFTQLHDGDLETVIYHTTSSAYLLEMSMHHMALQSITQGFQIALQIGLNNETLWPSDESEIVSRQGLWWTLYFLDKRITQKCGITYFLREDESAVSDFGNLKDNVNSGKHETLQSLVSFSRLWAHIWDGFFSPQAPRADDWGESQMMDTRIMIAYRQIPSNLHWKSSMVSQYMIADGETHARRRLIVFLRFQSLRLSIRHKTLSSDEHDNERRKTAIEICKAIIEAIRNYMATTTSLKPIGYILTTALVESLYHVLPEESRAAPVVSNKLLKDLIDGASQALQSLSKSVATASKIYDYLKDLLPPNDKYSSLDAFVSGQNATDQNMPLDCSLDLDALSDSFWGDFSNQPSEPIHMGEGNKTLPLLPMGRTEIFTMNGWLFNSDDLQGQMLTDLRSESMELGNLSLNCTSSRSGRTPFA